MYINQLEKGSPVELQVNNHHEKLSFPSQIVSVYRNPYEGYYYIGIEPILSDSGKLLSFGSMPVTVIATNLSDHRDYQFKSKKQGFNKEHTEYLLMTDDNAEPINHREAHRIPCNYKVILRIGDSRHASNGYVHDISFSGISFIFLTEYFEHANVGDPVSASLYVTEDRIVKVSGEVMRFVPEFTSGTSLVGVRFVEPSSRIISLIAELQRREARVAHGNNHGHL